MLEDDTQEKIRYLMNKYKWCHQEAIEYLFYAPYDPIDWFNSTWENTYYDQTL